MSKYSRDVSKYEKIDVYDLIQLYDVKNPALQHALKKILMAGDRGHKDFNQDCQDIIDSATRAKELNGPLNTELEAKVVYHTVFIKEDNLLICNVESLTKPFNFDYRGISVWGNYHYFNKEDIIRVVN